MHWWTQTYVGTFRVEIRRTKNFLEAFVCHFEALEGHCGELLVEHCENLGKDRASLLVCYPEARVETCPAAAQNSVLRFTKQSWPHACIS